MKIRRSVWLLFVACSAANVSGQVSLRDRGPVTRPGSSRATDRLARVVGVVRTRQGTVLVLDQRRRQIVAFDSTGHPLFTNSGTERGHAGLAIPVAMKAQSSNALVVWDAGAQRGIQFRVSGESLSIGRHWNAAIDAGDFCLLADRLYLFGLSAGRIVHEVRDSLITRSFGQPFGPPNVAAQRRLSRGVISCDGASGQIFLAPTQLPFVRAYDTNGRLLWQTRLANFAAVQTWSSRDGTQSYRPPAGGSDVVISVAPVYHRMLLVQTGRITAESRSPFDFRSVSTRLLDAKTGAELSVQYDLPQLVGIDHRDAFVLQWENAPSLRAVDLHISRPEGR